MAKQKFWNGTAWEVVGTDAEKVAITDATGVFTSTNVEGALKEAIDKANSAFQSASDGKTAVANAVTAKGVTASPADTFPTLATKIGQIPTGKKFATGSVVVSPALLGFTDGNNVVQQRLYFSVSGLDFIPSTVLLVFPYTAPNSHIILYQKDKFRTDSAAFDITVHRTSQGQGTEIAQGFKTGVQNGFVGQGGFTLPTHLTVAGSGGTKTATYYAYE